MESKIVNSGAVLLQALATVSFSKLDGRSLSEFRDVIKWSRKVSWLNGVAIVAFAKRSLVVACLFGAIEVYVLPEGNKPGSRRESEPAGEEDSPTRASGGKK